MYRSQDPTNAMPQVAILLSREQSSSNQQHIFSSRIFLLPEGRSLLSERDSTINGFLWRSPWSTLLQTTFGEDLDTLLSGDIGRPFTLFLAALPNLREPDLRYEEQRRVAVLDEIFFMHPMLWSYEQAGSAKFLEFACIRLPELSDCLHSAYCEIDPEQSYTLGSLAMQEIAEACRCSLHVRRAEGQPDHKTCLSTLAKTIGIYLWLLYVSDIEADVCPSINGLCNLYKWQLDFEDRQERDRHKAAVRNAEKAAQLATRLAKLRGKERGKRRELLMQFELLKRFNRFSYQPPTNSFQPGKWMSLAFYVLTGISPESSPLEGAYEYRSRRMYNCDVARVGEGLVFYRRALEDPNLSPALIAQVCVRRGYITHAGSRYSAINDIPTEYTFGQYNIDFQSRPDNPRSILPVVVVQATDNPSQLGMAVQVDFFDYRGQRLRSYLGLGNLYKEMHDLLKLSVRSEPCQLHRVESLGRSAFNWTGEECTERKAASSLPMLGLPMLDKTSIDHAQHFLAEYNHDKRPWILSLEISKRSEVPDGQVIAAAAVGEPLYLHLLMSTLNGTLLQLSTFTQCARGIVELGCWRHFYSTWDIIKKNAR